ncbi:MAG: D-amino acid aminotransferase, partial [Lachnospiraceae bacterium]|nr:D-amino acid aminotransferase [Lachnospiraceae bacterium]
KIQIPYTKAEISSILYDMLEKMDDSEIFIYWQMTRGTGLRQHQFPDAETKPNFWIFMKPGKHGDSSHRLKLTTIEDTRFLHCNIKTLNLLPNVMAAQKAESLGCDECIFHRGDIVTECAHSNVSILKDGVFKTHPTDHYILPGITRMHIIQICKDNGIPVDETPFTLKELLEADEVLVSSSTKFCAPAYEVDGTPVGGKAPELVTLIQEKYLEKFNNDTQ